MNHNRAKRDHRTGVEPAQVPGIHRLTVITVSATAVPVSVKR